MPVLFKDRSHLFQDSFLFGIRCDMTQKYSPLGESVKQVLYRSLQWQHTRRDNGDIIELCLAQRFWRTGDSIPVWSSISLPHTKLVCSMSFLAFCLPKCT